MDASAIGWREAALAVAVVLALYVGFALFRLTQMKAGDRQGGAGFGELLRLSAELRELRAEVAALREDVAHLKATRGVAPQYNEAVALADRGADAQAIAERCGISVAEAELVRALSQRQRE